MSSLRHSNVPNPVVARGRPPLRALHPVPVSRRPRRRRFEGYRGALAVMGMLLALVAVVWLAPVAALNLSTGTIAWLEARQTATGQGIATIALGAVALLGLVLAWARQTALGRPVSLPAGGRIGVDEIATRLEQLVTARDDIRRASVRVDNLHRRGLRVSVQIHVAAHANLTEAIQAVSESTELLLHGHLLVRLSSAPSVDVHFDELDLRSGQVHDQRTGTADR